MIKSPTAQIEQYRADIDGLRAIAVLSVIVFHVDKALLPGGFVGVDVFFVISGFLISQNILRGLHDRTFSISEFYRRRVKRIAPAMLVVVLATLGAAQVLFLPEDAEAVAKSAFWSLLSLANVYFWRHNDSSYFAAATSDTPLLHLWSLGVEEQFYLIWPLLLVFAFRPHRTRALFIWAVAAALASFLLGEFTFLHDPSFAYCMLPTRAGELLLGALVALAISQRTELRLPNRTRAALGAFGAALLGGSLALLSEEHVFPGLLAIPPTLGTALLLFSGHCGHNWISRLLALRPLVIVGLISYSAYLWHWPLIAFYRYGHPEVGFTAGLTLIVLTLLLAWLSYVYVETPARSSKASVARTFMVQYVAPAGVLALLAVSAAYADGYGIRWFSDSYKADLAIIRQQTRPAYQYEYVCQRQRLTKGDAEDDRCILGVESTKAPNAILWGDSNAAHFVGMIGAIALEGGFRYRNLEIGSCPPIAGDPEGFVTASRLADCRESSAIAREAVSKSDVVMISASWSTYQAKSAEFLSSFFQTANALAETGKLVILIGKAPVITGYDRRCPEKALGYPFLSCPRASVSPSEEVAAINAQLFQFAALTPNVEYFDVTPYLCSRGRCSAFDASGIALYYDPDHLSLAGSWNLGKTIVHRDGVPLPFSLVRDWPNVTPITHASTKGVLAN